MPRAKHDHYAALRPIVAQLARLTHDELGDLCDILRADAATQERDLPKRHGKPPVNPADGHALILFGGWQYRENPPAYTDAARIELQRTYADTKALPPEARALIGDVANALYHAHAPIKQRRRDATGQAIAGGNLQARVIYRKVLNRDTLQVEKRGFGPYLYYRYWTTGGDANKRGKRLASEYIGRQALALLFDATEPGSTERRELEASIIAAHHAGTLDDLMLQLGLQTEPDASADHEETPDDLHTIQKLRNQKQEVTEDAPQAATMSLTGVKPFMPDYRPEPSRRMYHAPHELNAAQREVLATIAAGMQYSAGHKEGINARKMARGLAELDMLKEVTGDPNHRKHVWRLTEYGLNLIRQDTSLQAIIAPKLMPMD